MSTTILQDTEQRPFMTPQDVSEVLQVSVYTVRRWIKEGTLPAYKVGRLWRIETVDFEQWLDQQKHHDDGRGSS
jgi:excisionase family DNA binding protein